MTEEFRDKIIGSKIKAIRPMTAEEIETIYGNDLSAWRKPFIIELDSGIEINAQADEENNSPGVFAFFDKNTGKEANDWDFVKEA